MGRRQFVRVDSASAVLGQLAYLYRRWFEALTPKVIAYVGGRLLTSTIMSITVDTPPYQLTELVPDFLKVYCNPISHSFVVSPSDPTWTHRRSIRMPDRVFSGFRCAQTSINLDKHLRSPGPEIYVGCSNGQLLRFGLQADSPNQVSSMGWSLSVLIRRASR